MVNHREEKKKEIDELIQKVDQGISGIYESDQWSSFLAFCSRTSITKYSIRNMILIFSQNPLAKQVQGYRAWQKEGYQVRTGEKGLKILAPVIIKSSKNREETEEQESKLVGYRKITVFDIDQTKLIEKERTFAKVLEGDVIDYSTNLAILKKISPYPVHFREETAFPIGSRQANGYCNFSTKEIVIKKDLSEAQIVKILIHEIAHSIYHQTDMGGEKRSAQIQEMEAESLAFILSHHMGIDTSQYSFPYIASWTKSFTPEERIFQLSMISTAAEDLISRYDLEKEKYLAPIRDGNPTCAQYQQSLDTIKQFNSDHQIFAHDQVQELQGLIHRLKAYDFDIQKNYPGNWTLSDHQQFQSLQKNVPSRQALEELIHLHDQTELSVMDKVYLDEHYARLNQLIFSYTLQEFGQEKERERVYDVLGMDRDNDGVIDRLDADFRDPDIQEIGHLDQKEKEKHRLGSDDRER